MTTSKVVPCDNLKCVQSLLSEEKVNSLNFSDKKQLISSPKPTPDLCIIQTTNSHRRQFNRSVYKTQWIAGCSHTNKLYCWYCIFFSNEKNSWNTTGFDDLNNLAGAIKRHQNSQKHMNSVISFSNFGKKRSLARQLCDEISKHNSRVDHNRRVFQRCVDIVCHLAQQELPFRGHDESETSLNKGHFLELVSLLSKYDLVLEKHMQHENGRPGLSCLSDKIENDIIHSIAEVIKSRIEYEIKITNFVSVIIDETPDVNRKQLCVILRYCFGSDIHHRFLGFIDVSESGTADTLSKLILKTLNEHNCTKKLVSQSYDSAGVTTGVKKEVQQIIKESCPQALFVWCNAHILNLVLSKSCSRIAEVSSFFSALQALSKFFSNNTKLAAFYDKHCSKRLPDTSVTCWSYSSCLVNTVFDQKDRLIDLFTCMYDIPQEWDGDSILSAENFLNILQSFNFNFFLSVFHPIFEKTDCLFNVIQKSQADVSYCINKIKEFESWLCDEFRVQFDSIYENCLQNSTAPRLRYNVTCVRTEYKRLFIQVLDNIYFEIDTCYSEICKLQFFQLFNNTLYQKYRSEFPTQMIDELLTSHGNYFDKHTLKNQLICLYSSPELRDRNVFEIIDFINENSLEDAFSQLLKLAHLVATIPATFASPERSFASLERIYTHLRNTQDQERLSELSIIAIEKQLLVELKRSSTFYSEVIKSFLKRDKSIDLEYK